MPRYPAKSSFETEVDVDGTPTPVVVEYSYHPGHSGRTYGPPEDCYPPEGAEAEIERIYAVADPTKADLSAKVKTEVQAQLSEQSCYEAEEAEESAYEAAADAKYDAWKEDRDDRECPF